jgi:hypothetical protein
VTSIEEAREAKRLQEDFPYFCENFIKIKNKRAEIVPFKLHKYQVRLWQLMQEQEKAGKPVRVIVLKSRQLGFSTMMQAYLLWRTITNPYSGCLTVAHDDKSSSQLFSKIEFAYENLPKQLFNELEQIKNTAIRGKKLTFGKGLDSEFHVDTAGNKNVGRSMTFQRCHLSEVAFWDDIEKTMYGLMAALGKRPGTECVLESTANGLGTYHYKLWKRATSGESMWAPFFCGWSEDPDCQMPAPEDFEKNAEEKDLARRYKLNNDQIYWRRITIEDECGGDVDLFRQEYPIEPDEAFIVSGNPYFGPKVIEKTMKQCKDPVNWGDIELVNGKPTLVRGRDEGVDKDKSTWWIWKTPEKDHPYVIGADVAGGTGKDYSSAHVLDLQSEEYVATYRGKCDPDEFAFQLRWMGLSYNVALIAPEKNGEGRATLLTLYKQLHYPRIFFHVEQEEWSGGVRYSYGWRTTVRSRPTMLAQFAAALREQTPKLYCERTTRELASFIRVDSPQKLAEAAEGANDDMVISAGIANASEVRLNGGSYVDLSEYMTDEGTL